MQNPNDPNELMEMIAQVLIRCFILGTGSLIFWWLALTVMGDTAYAVHYKFVPISRQHFNVIHYAGMLLTKGVNFLGFLFPYIAIKLVLKKRA